MITAQSLLSGAAFPWESSAGNKKRKRRPPALPPPRQQEEQRLPKTLAGRKHGPPRSDWVITALPASRRPLRGVIRVKRPTIRLPVECLLAALVQSRPSIARLGWLSRTCREWRDLVSQTDSLWLGHADGVHRRPCREPIHSTAETSAREIVRLGRSRCSSCTSCALVPHRCCCLVQLPTCFCLDAQQLTTVLEKWHGDIHPRQSNFTISCLLLPSVHGSVCRVSAFDQQCELQVYDKESPPKSSVVLNVTSSKPEEVDFFGWWQSSNRDPATNSERAWQFGHVCELCSLPMVLMNELSFDFELRVQGELGGAAYKVEGVEVKYQRGRVNTIWQSK